MKTLKGVSDLAGVMTLGATLAIGFVVFIVVLSLGGSLLSSLQAGQTAGTSAYYVTGNGTLGLLNISSQSSNIGLIIGIVLILLILIGGLGFFLYRKME